MKTKYLYITAIFLLGHSAPAPAQSETGAFDGVQGSVNQWAESAAESFESLKKNYDELIRLAWIFGSDIQMMMNAKFEEEHYNLPWLIDYYRSEYEGSLYAQFDWQNMAESIRVKSTENETRFDIMPLTTLKKSVPAEDFTMYVDAQGYWYVPIEGEGFPEGFPNYVQANVMGGMKSIAQTLEVSIEAAIEAKITEMLDHLVLELLVLGWKDWQKELGHDYKEVYEAYDITVEWNEGYDDFSASSNEDVIEEKLKPVLEKLAKSQFEKLRSMPPLIHFAFIISPTLARSQFDVREESVSFMGQVLSTKMTLVSGPDAGYQIIFDRYGRLIHLIDTKGDTASYWYDKDVTVNIPPAIPMENLATYFMQFGK